MDALATLILFGAAATDDVGTATFLRAGSFSLIPAFAAVVVGDRIDAGGWLSCRRIGMLDCFMLHCYRRTNKVEVARVGRKQSGELAGPKNLMKNGKIEIHESVSELYNRN